MDEIQKNKLEEEIQEAAIVRDFCKHSGFSILKREIDGKLNDMKNSWLTATADEAEKYRISVQVYNEVLYILKAKMIRGDSAARALQMLSADVEQI